jgi:hypothetical protein
MYMDRLARLHDCTRANKVVLANDPDSCQRPGAPSRRLLLLLLLLLLCGYHRA